MEKEKDKGKGTEKPVKKPTTLMPMPVAKPEPKPRPILNPPKPKVDAELEKKILDAERRFLDRDHTLGGLAEDHDLTRFVFSVSDVANVARAVKDICEAFGITRDEYYSAYINSIGGSGVLPDEDGSEEGEEEEYEEYEEEYEGESEEEPPEESGDGLLDDEFIKDD